MSALSMVDELFALLKEVGAKPTLYGKPITAEEVKDFAWVLTEDKFLRYVRTAALRSWILPIEKSWSPYP